MVIESLASGKSETFLLYGVTGSGKTEVYIRVIEEVVRYGRQAIVLVPKSVSLRRQSGVFVSDLPRSQSCILI